MSATPLSGVRVLDLTTFLSGPVAAMALVQLGADVIKVEPPSGDPTRAGRVEPDSYFWFALHRGKRSIVLDLKQDHDRRQFLTLVAQADVVLDNYRPGVIDRLGIGAEVLRSVNPAVISCSITGYGNDGAQRDATAIDGVVQAFTGGFELVEIAGGTGPIPLQVADLAGGSAAAQAVLAALYARERDGRARHVEVSLASALLPWLSVADRMGTLRSPNTIVATGSDGVRFVVQTPLHFRARLADLLGLTYVESEDYADLVRTRLAADTGEAWMRIIGEAGIPVAPLQTFAAALALEDTDSIEVDGHLLPGVPFSFDGGRHRVAARPPNLGEHQVEVVGS